MPLRCPLCEEILRCKENIPYPIFICVKCSYSTHFEKGQWKPKDKPPINSKM